MSISFAGIDTWDWQGQTGPRVLPALVRAPAGARVRIELAGVRFAGFTADQIREVAEVKNLVIVFCDSNAELVAEWVAAVRRTEPDHVGDYERSIGVQ